MMRLARIICIVTVLALGGGPATAEPPRASMPIANYQWDWDGFKKYWSNHLGRTTGVVGIVVMVVGAGVLIIMSARKKT